ncbi:hypothetical protein GRI55_05150 [Erythrobacter citreus]|uniref:Uncharacterized protein n=1 Tax=Qipengyuania citrea TaxID=225971 RepID=A0A6I4U964_9SPHN|nr:hypothetical protein [Qipengyuania citrea]MDQ0566807.1 hypothetical protein [Qipengyuania citrea]MXP35158.1 hypothetical protein [Qipengyuania citrea]
MEKTATVSTQANKKVSESTTRMAQILGVEFHPKQRWTSARTTDEHERKRA